jgi:hypothetical protein
MVDLDEGPSGRKPLLSAFDVGGVQHELTFILKRRVDLVCAATPCTSPWQAPPLRGEAWWARQDSNLRPNRYERSALTN